MRQCRQHNVVVVEDLQELRMQDKLGDAARPQAGAAVQLRVTEDRVLLAGGGIGIGMLGGLHGRGD